MPVRPLSTISLKVFSRVGAVLLSTRPVAFTKSQRLYEVVEISMVVTPRHLLIFLTSEATSKKRIGKDYASRTFSKTAFFDAA
jgi:hypothetical protein